MSGTWYPSLQDQLEAEHRLIDRRADDPSGEELDWESAIYELAAEGNIDALEALREHLDPIDYDELGWAD